MKSKIKLIKTSGMFFVALNIAIAISAAWFTLSDKSEMNGSTMSAYKYRFELASLNTRSEYDGSLYKNNTLVLSTGDIYDEIYYATNSEKNINEISWMLNADSNIGNYGENITGIGPKKSGKLTFYVIPKESGTMKVDFALDLGIFTESTNGSSEEKIKIGDKSYFRIEDHDSNLVKFMKGHLYFFEEYSEEGYYSKLIYDENNELHFSKTFENAVEGTPYPVNIYWIWPYVMGNILLPPGDVYQSGEAIFTEESADREKIAQNMINNINYYFFELDNEQYNPNTYIEDFIKGSTSDDFNNDAFSAFSAAWNRADNLLGTTVNYLRLTLTAK